MIPVDAFRRVVAPAMLIALAAVACAQNPSLSRVRTALEAARKKHHVPGMSVAIVKDGKVIFAEGFGLRDVQKNLRATADTAYEIGSATKSFTALLATQAAVDGKLSLSDPPTKYLPNFRLKDPDANAKITIGDMMSHNSGLPRVDLAWYTNAFKRDELMRLLAEAEPTAKLGQKWQYQNLMYLFTGVIEEKVYGKPYETLIQERFFQPLGMARSSVTLSDFTATSERAVGYDPNGANTGKHPLPIHDIDVCAPAGAIGSTVNDMAKYVRMLLADGQFEGRSLFSKEAIAETRKRRIAMVPGTPMGYGYGWMLHPWEGRSLVEHGGNIDGFNAEIALLPDEHLGAVVLTNVSSSPLAMEAAQIALKEFLPAAKEAPAAKGPALPSVKLGPKDEAPEAFLGNYRLEVAKIDLRFFREGGKTYIEQSGQRVALTLIGPGKYEVPTGPKPVITFAADPKDPKKAIVTFEVGPNKLPLTRQEPYASPISADDLLAKAVEARGGASALRQHRSMVVRYRGRLMSDAVDVAGLRYYRGTDLADYQVLRALGRRFAESRTFSEENRAGSVMSFSQPSLKTGPEAASAVLSGNQLADLEPKRWYKSLEVVREDKVGAEEVYVLKKTPLAGGAPITDYLSKTNFRLLRRDVGPTAKSEYSDFRTIEGITLPFQSVSYSPDGARYVTEVVSVKFDERVPDWLFKVPVGH
jgi:CubicO group peptidase (beta-lactamase class C family)